MSLKDEIIKERELQKSEAQQKKLSQKKANDDLVAKRELEAKKFDADRAAFADAVEKDDVPSEWVDSLNYYLSRIKNAFDKKGNDFSMSKDYSEQTIRKNFFKFGSFDYYAKWLTKKIESEGFENVKVKHFIFKSKYSTEEDIKAHEQKKEEVYDEKMYGGISIPYESVMRSVGNVKLKKSGIKEEHGITVSGAINGKKSKRVNGVRGFFGLFAKVFDKIKPIVYILLFLAFLYFLTNANQVIDFFTGLFK